MKKQHEKAIASFVSNMESHKSALMYAQRRIKLNRENRAKLLELMTPIFQMADAASDATDVTVSAEVDIWSDNITMYVYLNKLQSFKDPIVIDVLEHFTNMFYHPEDTDETNDFANSMEREFRFRSERLNLRVVVTAHVKSDSATCRKVMVGTETKTVEKFALICD